MYVDVRGGRTFFNPSVEKQSVAIRIAIPFLVDVTFESGLNRALSLLVSERRCGGYLCLADNNLRAY